MDKHESFTVTLEQVVPKVDPLPDPPFELPKDLYALSSTTAIRPEAVDNGSGKQVIDLDELKIPGTYDIWTDPKMFFSYNVMQLETELGVKLGTRGLLYVAHLPHDSEIASDTDGLVQTYIMFYGSAAATVSFQRIAKIYPGFDDALPTFSWESWNLLDSTTNTEFQNHQLRHSFVAESPEKYGAGTLKSNDNLNKLVRLHGTYVPSADASDGLPEGLPHEIATAGGTLSRSWVLYDMKYGQMITSGVGLFCRHYNPVLRVWHDWAKADIAPVEVPNDVYLLSNANSIRPSSTVDTSGKEAINLELLLSPGTYDIWTDPVKFSSMDIRDIENKLGSEIKLGRRGLLRVSKIPIESSSTSTYPGLVQTYEMMRGESSYTVTFQRVLYQNPNDPTESAWQDWKLYNSPSESSLQALSVQRGFILYSPESMGEGHLGSKDNMNQLLHSAGTYTQDREDYSLPQNMPDELVEDNDMSWTLYYHEKVQMIYAASGVYVRTHLTYNTWSPWKNLMDDASSETKYKADGDTIVEDTLPDDPNTKIFSVANSITKDILYLKKEVTGTTALLDSINGDVI